MFISPLNNTGLYYINFRFNGLDYTATGFSSAGLINWAFEQIAIARSFNAWK
jgi:hypothetical protein